MVVDLKPITDGLEVAWRGHASRGEWPEIVRTLEKLIQDNTNVLALIRNSYDLMARFIFQAAEAGVTLNRDQLGQSLQATIDSGLDLLNCLDSWRQRTQEHGEAVKGAASLTAIIEEVGRLRSEAFHNWPWTPTKEEWDEAVAEFGRGESVDIDDAFAEAAGMSRDEWVRKVDERRQTRGG